jgi:ADP-heptose:LPS heptosyltransferase
MINRNHNDSLELQKLRPVLLRYLDNHCEELPPSRDIPSGKTALIIRWGAIGDMVFTSPLPRLIKEQGYYVVVNTQRQGLSVLQENPYIDEFWFQERGVIDPPKMHIYIEKIKDGFDKVVDLTQSIEREMLEMPDDKGFKMADDLDENYIDHTIRKAGFDATGLNGELYFTDEEEKAAKDFLEEFKDKFVVLVCLLGSSIHKAYPWWQFIFNEQTLYKDMPDLVTITTGDEWARLLDWEHPQNISGSANLPLRKSLLLAKYADLVIGPETGIMNGAGCFDTPKICLLTHSSRDNLCKYWKNDYSLTSLAECSPCHKMVYSREQCEIDPHTTTCQCISQIKPDMVIKRIKEVYKEWKRKKFRAIITPSQYHEERKSCQPLVIL